MSRNEILISITMPVVSGLILTAILYFIKHLYESYKQHMNKKLNEFHAPPQRRYSKAEQEEIDRRANKINEEIVAQLKKDSAE